MTFVSTWSWLLFLHLSHLHLALSCCSLNSSLMASLIFTEHARNISAHGISTHCSLFLDISSPRFMHLTPTLPSALYINITFPPPQLPIPLQFKSLNTHPMPIWVRYCSRCSGQISKQNRQRFPLSWVPHSSGRRQAVNIDTLITQHVGHRSMLWK